MVQPHCAKAAAAGAANGLQGGSSGEKIPPAHTKNLSQHQLAPASWRDVFFGKTIDLRLRSFGTCRRTLSRIIELHVPRTPDRACSADRRLLGFDADEIAPPVPTDAMISTEKKKA